MNAHEASRRSFLKTLGAGAAAMAMPQMVGAQNEKRPNILFAISDDQSWPHAGAYGSRMVNTPAFNRIAREGILFNNAFVAAPQCSPNRAALLTGRNVWQIEEAGTHGSYFPSKYQVYPEILEEAGYHIGYTGKPWGPGNWKGSGRKQNPAGKAYNGAKMNPMTSKIAKTDYAANFGNFLTDRQEGEPFCFWYGAHEPHRSYEAGSGSQAGKTLDDVDVPPFLPDNDIVRSDILDYALEIDWFDLHLARIVEQIEAIGELDNTLILVTSDNGMPFPRAKANLYEYGVHMPLAIRWGDKVSGGRVVDDLIGFIDFAPTFLEAAGIAPPEEMTGKSFMNILLSDQSGQVDANRAHTLIGRERHSHSRPDNLAYPCRGIRTKDYLYIRNIKPDRWPAGDGPGYYDIDSSPSKTVVMEYEGGEGNLGRLSRLSLAKRPEEELFAVRTDPGCMKNLANNPAYAEIKNKLRTQLDEQLIEQGDPRALGYGDIIESYPRFNSMRPKQFEGFAEYGNYNLEYRRKAEAVLKRKIVGAGPDKAPDR